MSCKVPWSQIVVELDVVSLVLPKQETFLPDVHSVEKQSIGNPTS
jgi:hypothetical protein